ncbi:MAG: DUF4189 domain-containing protein [Nitratireductor sp.]
MVLPAVLEGAECRLWPADGGAGSACSKQFGAIAYSPNTGAHGYSYDYSSRGEAETYAMNECRKYAGDCRVAIWFRNACGALAVGNIGGWGSGWGDGQQRVVEAINTCQQYFIPAIARSSAGPAARLAKFGHQDWGMKSSRAGFRPVRQSQAWPCEKRPGLLHRS